MKTLLIYLYETCCLSEVSVIGWMLNDTGDKFAIRTCAITPGPITTLEGWKVTPDMALNEIDDIGPYDGLIFPGGEVVVLPEKLRALIHQFDAEKKLIGAVCAGPKHLALAGLLDTYSYTTSLRPEFFDSPEEDPFPRARYTGQRCTVDRHVITADGIAFLEFTDAILGYIGAYSPQYGRKAFRAEFTPTWQGYS